MLQFSQFVWALRSSVWDVFNNFLLIDATDGSKISSDQKRFFIVLCLYPQFNILSSTSLHSRSLPLKSTLSGKFHNKMQTKGCFQVFEATNTIKTNKKINPGSLK